MLQLVSPVNCYVISHLDWFEVPAAWSMWWRNSVCFYTCWFYFCLCAMSHTATVLAPNLDLLQHPSSYFTTGHSTLHFLLYCPGIFLPLLCSIRGNLQCDILSLQQQYLHNIKQITSGWGHVPASKHTSRRSRWPCIDQMQHCQDWSVE